MKSKLILRATFSLFVPILLLILIAVLKLLRNNSENGDSHVDLGTYGPFSEGMRRQRMIGIPKFLLNDLEPDYDRMWDFMQIYSQVVWDAARPNLSTITVNMGTETKHFIKFANPDAECHFVTLGVGGTIKAERPFKAQYPQCNFLGVDPDGERNRPVYESLGERAKFLATAVHLQSGRQKGHFFTPAFLPPGVDPHGAINLHRPRYERLEDRAKFLIASKASAQLKSSGLDEKNFSKPDTYHSRVDEMEHTGIEELLGRHFNGTTTMIDIFDLDVEGSEYSLMGWLSRRVRQQSPIICQMNIEFHYPIRKFDHTSYNESLFFADLEHLMQTHALLNTGKNLGSRNLLLHTVNVAEPKCLMKLLVGA